MSQTMSSSYQPVRHNPKRDQKPKAGSVDDTKDIVASWTEVRRIGEEAVKSSEAAAQVRLRREVYRNMQWVPHHEYKALQGFAYLLYKLKHAVLDEDRETLWA